ncbi:MAG: hypothetical protein AVDCRST_MAG33-3275, partial [uncultured Thermomicrobiales bacterium]
DGPGRPAGCDGLASLVLVERSPYDRSRDRTRLVVALGDRVSPPAVGTRRGGAGTRAITGSPRRKLTLCGLPVANAVSATFPLSEAIARRCGRHATLPPVVRSRRTPAPGRVEPPRRRSAGAAGPSASPELPAGLACPDCALAWGTTSYHFSLAELPARTGSQSATPLVVHTRLPAAVLPTEGDGRWAGAGLGGVGSPGSALVVQQGPCRILPGCDDRRAVPHPPATVLGTGVV